MRELLIILVVVAVLVGLTAFRYRKQIIAVYQFWAALRSIQQKNAKPQVDGSGPEGTGPLVNCSRCKTWTSETTAIRLGTRTYYCSAACMEKAATAV